GSPSRRAPLSNASPAASSSVVPSTRKPPRSRTSSTIVCPPLASRHVNGGSRSSGLRESEATCPCRWPTGCRGRRSDQAGAFPPDTPTSSAPISPWLRRHCDRADVTELDVRAAERLANDGDDELEVPPRRHLRHNASESSVQLGLRGNDVRKD